MYDLNYTVYIVFLAILYAAWGAEKIGQAVKTAQMFKSIFYVFLVCFVIPLLVSTVMVLITVHAFCFELYNALAANGITIEQLVEGAR